jgi:hypothetical protein
VFVTVLHRVSIDPYSFSASLFMHFLRILVFYGKNTKEAIIYLPCHVQGGNQKEKGKVSGKQ